MKNTSFKILLLAFILQINLASCQKTGQTPTGYIQKISFKLDNVPVPLSATVTNKGDDIYTSNFVKQNEKFGISIMSERNDFKFAFAAQMTELKVGTYQVFKCIAASECDETESKWNQYVGISPYPKKDGTLDESKIKLGHKIPKLGLSPITLTITKITEEQPLGSGFKTKKVYGVFSGNLANVASKDYNWSVVGPTTKIECEFELYCTVL
jgi:hypothetical protein